MIRYFIHGSYTQLRIIVLGFRSEMMRLTSQVKLIVQFENIMDCMIFPAFIRRYLKDSICLVSMYNSPIVTVKPNEKRGKVSKSYKIFSRFVPKKLLDSVSNSYCK